MYFPIRPLGLGGHPLVKRHSFSDTPVFLIDVGHNNCRLRKPSTMVSYTSTLTIVYSYQLASRDFPQRDLLQQTSNRTCMVLRKTSADPQPWIKQACLQMLIEFHWAQLSVTIGKKLSIFPRNGNFLHVSFSWLTSEYQASWLLQLPTFS